MASTANRVSSLAKIGPEAEVRPEGEGEDLARDAGNVENIRIGDATLVTIGRPGQDHDEGTLPQRLAMEIDLSRRRTAHVVGDRLVPEDLLHRVGNQSPVFNQEASLVRVVTKQLAGPANGIDRRVTTGTGYEDEEVEQFVAPEHPASTRFVLELQVQKFAHEIVGGILGPIIEVLAEPDRGFSDATEGVDVLPCRSLVLGAVEGVSEGRQIRVGEPKQHADDLNGQHVGKVLYEVELVVLHQGLGGSFEEGADTVLNGADGPWGEEPGHEPPVNGVERRILEDEKSGGQIDPRRSDLVDAALGRAECVTIGEDLGDVIEPCQGPEVVLLVSIDRRLVAHTSVHGVRRRVKVPVVHVEVDVCGRHGHGQTPCSARNSGVFADLTAD